MKEFKPIDLESLATTTEHINRPEVSPERQALGREEFRKRQDELTVDAILQHVKAVSYRAFRVGSAALADLGDKYGFEITWGHNFKPRRIRQHQWDKLCAENNTCTTAILDGAQYISGIVVASHHQEIGEDAHDKIYNNKALHSCLNCRNLFRELIRVGIMSGETIIRFVDDGSLVYEDESDKEILKGVIDDSEEIIELPKLKLRKETITERDVANLPAEEMTMGEFLNLYRDDRPATAGKAPPPYTLPSSRVGLGIE